MYFRAAEKYIATPTQILRNGVRFPLHQFISDFLIFTGIGLAQLVPNSYIHLVCFIAFCHQMRTNPSLDFFFSLFSLTKTREPGFRVLNKIPGRKAWMPTPSSNKGWHPDWFFIHASDIDLLPSWGEPQRLVLGYDNLSPDRKKEFQAFCQRIPSEGWNPDLLSNKQWLFDHQLTFNRPQIPTLISTLPTSSSEAPHPVLKRRKRLARKGQFSKARISLPAEPSNPPEAEPFNPPEAEPFNPPEAEPSQQLPPEAEPSQPPPEAEPNQPPPEAEPFNPPEAEPSQPILSQKRDFAQVSVAEKLEKMKRKYQKVSHPQTSSSEQPPSIPSQSQSLPSTEPQTHTPTEPPTQTAPLPDPQPSTSSFRFPLHGNQLEELEKDLMSNSFFNTDPNQNYPHYLYKFFNLPADDFQLKKCPNRELVLGSALYMGRTLSCFSRLLEHELKGNGSDAIINKLTIQLRAAKDENKELEEHKNAVQRSFEGMHEAFRESSLALQRSEQINKGLQAQLQQQNAQIKAAEAFQQLNADLQNQIKEKDDRISRLLETNKKGHAEHKKLLTYATDLKKNYTDLESKLAETKKNVIADYRASPELLEEICEEFFKGYRTAMDKVQEAGIDPKSVDPSYEKPPPN